MKYNEKTEMANILHFKNKTLISQSEKLKIEKIFGYILIGSFNYIVTENGNIFKKINDGFERVEDKSLVDMARKHIKDISGHEFTDNGISNKVAVLVSYDDEKFLQDPTVQEVVGSINYDGKVCHITDKGEVFADYMYDSDLAYDKAEIIMDLQTKRMILDLYTTKLINSGASERNA